jgi:hypothetical protein
MMTLLSLNGRLVPAMIMVGLLAGLAGSANAATILALDDPSTVGIDLIFNDTDGDGFVDTGGFVSIGGFAGVYAAGFGNTLTTSTQLGGVLGSFEEASAVVLFTQTDFSGDGTALSTISGSTAGALFYSGYYDPSNTAFGLANPIGTPFLFGPSAFSDSTSGPVGGAPFSMTQVVGVNHGPGQLLSTEFESALTVTLTAVPEPATMTMFGAGLAAAAAARRRRKHPNRK